MASSVEWSLAQRQSERTSVGPARPHLNTCIKTVFPGIGIPIIQIRSSYDYNGNSCTIKIGYFYWDGPQGADSIKKMPSYQYRKSHCGDKTILRPSYLHNGISYTGKTTSLYSIRAPGLPRKLPTWVVPCCAIGSCFLCKVVTLCFHVYHSV